MVIVLAMLLSSLPMRASELPEQTPEQILEQKPEQIPEQTPGQEEEALEQMSEQMPEASDQAEQLLEQAPGITEEATADFDFFFLHSTTQMRLKRIDSYLKRNEFNLTMAKNEREGFQVGLRELEQDGRRFLLEVSDFLLDENSNIKLSPQVFTEGFRDNCYWDDINKVFAHYDPATVGHPWADYLIPYDNTPLVANREEYLPFYLEFRTGKDTVPGTYRGTVKAIDAVSGEEKSLAASVQVWDFALPEGHYSQTAFGLYNAASNYYSSSTFLRLSGVTMDENGYITSDLTEAHRIIKGYYDFLLDHGISAYEIPYSPNNFCKPYGIPQNEREFLRYATDPRVTTFQVPLPGINFDWLAGSYPDHEKQIREYYRVLKDKQLWLNKSYIYSWNEPSDQNIATWGEDYKAALSRIRSIWPGINVVSPGSINLDFQRGSNSIICPNISSFTEANYAKMMSIVNEWHNGIGGWHDDAGQVWAYPGGNPFPTYHLFKWDTMGVGLGNRSLNWSQYQLGIDGILYWNTCWWEDPYSGDVFDPWAEGNQYMPDYDLRGTGRLSSCGPNGDAKLIYPALPGADLTTPIASLRLKQIASGLNDYDYFKLAEEFCGKAFVDQQVAKLVYPQSAEIMLHGAGWGNLHTYILDEVRATLGRAIEKEMSSQVADGKGRDHAWGDWEVYLEPAKDDEGIELRICETCGAQESRQIPKVTPLDITVRERISARIHSAAIKIDNTLWAWGYNNNGQLGNGTVTNIFSPLKVMDNALKTSVGGNFPSGCFHTAAIKADSSLWAWGDNTYGQLGDGTVNAKTTPVKIMDNAAQVSCGAYHTLAIKTDGSLWAWGRNYAGVLGDGTSTTRKMPVKTMNDVVQVSTGLNHTMAVKADGSLWAWGWSLYGQLGDGSTNEIKTNPVKIMDDVAQVSCGEYHTLAIKTDGSLWAWGQNNYGQLGDGSTTNRVSPLKIMDNVAQVSAGEAHTAAIKADGSLWAWGQNDFCQLGDGTHEIKYLPVKIMDNAAAVSCGNSHTLAVKTDGSLWDWGHDQYEGTGMSARNVTLISQVPLMIMPEGSILPYTVPDICTVSFDTQGGAPVPLAQTVPGTTAASKPSTDPEKDNYTFIGWYNGNELYDFSRPVMSDITLSARWVATEILSKNRIAAGRSHSLVIKTDNSLWAWGMNSFGQLGNGTMNNLDLPAKITENILQVSANFGSSAIIDEDGSLWVFGENMDGQLGDGTTTRGSRPVKTMDNVAAVSLGYYNGAAVKNDGSLWTWGRNTYGQVGDGTTTQRLSPVKIMDNVREVSCGDRHVAALKTDGTLWIWGQNYAGVLGINISQANSPQKLMDNVAKIVCGDYHNLAIKTDGSLWVWGGNWYGELGNGKSVAEYSPLKIMDNVARVSAGRMYSAAIKTDGSLWTWGYNAYGQLGNGTKANKNLPGKIMDNVAQIFCGEIHALAVKTDGSLWAWGDNSYCGGPPSVTVPEMIMPESSIIVPYTIDIYPVSFDAKGGSPEPLGQMLYKGDRVSKPAKNPAKTGFTFVGWFLGDSLTPYDFNTPVTSCFTLTAKWSPYTVTFDSAGGTAKAAAKVNHGNKVSKPTNPTKTGFSFDGWYLGDTLYDFSMPVTESITLKACWSQITFNVTFNSAGGSNIDAEMVNYGKQVTKPADPSREGYTFAGWLKGSATYNFTSAVTANLTLSAKWTVNTYTISFDSQGGTAKTAVKVNYGSTVKKPTNPTKTGFSFDGWYLGDTLYDFTAPVSASFVLSAHWSQITFIVTFNSAGGSSRVPAIVFHGAQVTKPADPEREGYTFGGWLKGTAAYNFTKAVTADLTLTAKWTVNVYSVSFDSQGGTAKAAAKVNHGSTVKKPTNPTKTGFVFDGWYLGDSATPYDFTTPVTGAITLAARWLPK